MAHASAASSGLGIFFKFKSLTIIVWTWLFSALPKPVTDIFTCSGVISIVGNLCSAAVTKITPRAWATLIDFFLF
jgi:hypothetical protein